MPKCIDRKLQVQQEIAYISVIVATTCI